MLGSVYTPSFAQIAGRKYEKRAKCHFWKYFIFLCINVVIVSAHIIKCSTGMLYAIVLYARPSVCPFSQNDETLYTSTSGQE